MEAQEILKVLKSINFWKTGPKRLGFLRNRYLEGLVKTLGNNLVKVIVGQRRSGKSYLLKQLIGHLVTEQKVPRANILYLNFESEELQFVADQKSLSEIIKIYFSQLRPKGKVYIFLDEIQEVAGWEKLVSSYLAQETRSVEFLLTGSNSTMLSSELATYITGRYIEKTVFPFSFQEHLLFLKETPSKEHLIEFLKTSGIPELYNLNSLELRESFLNALRDSILMRDIVRRYAIKDVSLLLIIFQFLADNIANRFSFQTMAKKLVSTGVSTNVVTLSNYVHYLENAFLVHGVDRYDIKGKRILEGEKKYYLNDLGFRNYFKSSFDPGLTKHLENYVFLWLKMTGHTVYVGTIGEIEVDFVAEKAGQRSYYQVTYLLSDEDVVRREYGNLEKISDAWPKYVISLDDIAYPPRNGIQHIQAWKLAG